MSPVRLWIPRWVLSGNWKCPHWRRSSGAERALDEALKWAIGEPSFNLMCLSISLKTEGYIPEELQAWGPGPNTDWNRTLCIKHREVVPWLVPWNKAWSRDTCENNCPFPLCN